LLIYHQVLINQFKLFDCLVMIRRKHCKELNQQEQSLIKIHITKD
jgi:hypothetical protein